MENMNKSFIIRNGNVIGLSEKIGTTLSQEAYDALSEEKKNDGTIYFIPDGDGEIEIVDNEISETKLWSSQKTSDEIAEVETALPNIKKFASPSGTTKYITISAHALGDIEIHSAYAGKYMFTSSGSTPVFFGTSKYRGYTLTGWAWNADNTVLYLRVNGHMDFVVSAFGSDRVTISNMTTSAPDRITFNATFETNALASDVNPTIDISKVFSGGALNISTLCSTYGNGRYVIVGQGTAGNGSATIDIWTLTSNAISYIVNVTYSNRTSNIFIGYTYDNPTINFETNYLNYCNHIAKVCTLA